MVGYPDQKSFTSQKGEGRRPLSTQDKSGDSTMVYYGKLEVQHTSPSGMAPSGTRLEMFEEDTAAEMMKVRIGNKLLFECELCRICKLREADMLFKPCRHIITCSAGCANLQHCCPDPDCNTVISEMKQVSFKPQSD